MANYPRTVKTAKGRAVHRDHYTRSNLFLVGLDLFCCLNHFLGCFVLGYFCPDVYTKEEPLTVAWKGGEVMGRRSSQDGRL